MKKAVNAKAYDKEQMLMALIEEHKEQFYKIAYSYVRNEHDALEIFQETVYKAYLSISKLKKPDYMKTWFIRILINESKNLLSDNRKVVPLSDNVEIYNSDEKIARDPFNRVDRSHDTEQLLQRLNTQERIIVIMRYYEELSLKEIAHIVGHPLSTVKSTLYRSLNKLKVAMDEGEMI